jgi:2-oxoisovalerate dehydrogenase E1 component
MRPIVELMTVNFSLLALDQIMNTAATIRHMSGGQFGVPLVIRMATGAGKQLAAQHSHSLEGWYAHIPGLKVLAPATLEDARGMLWTALEDPDPVLIFENVMLYNRGADRRGAGPVDISTGRDPARGQGPEPHHLWRLALQDAGGGRGTGEGRHRGRGDRPAQPAPAGRRDDPGLARKTRRAVIVDEGWRTGSLSAEIMARIMEQGFWSLDGPVARVCSEEVPIPYPAHLEQAAIPQVDKIVAAARAQMGR